MSLDPILLIGGTGALGRRIAEWLRKRHPDLPLTLAARDLQKAQVLADQLGHADVTAIDLDRRDLGLADRRYSLVIPALKDEKHITYRFAQDRGLPYVALSEAAFEVGPLVAMYAHRPQTALVLGGHTHGGLPSLIALHLSHQFERVDAISIGAIFDPADPLPPGAEKDMARIMKAGPPPLAYVDSHWRWLAPDDVKPIVRNGETIEAEPAGLTDTIGLWAPSSAKSVRLDMGGARTAPGTDGNPSHEVIIEISGTLATGEAVTRRWLIRDPDGNVAFGAKGLALMAERLLGLDGRPAAKPGLYMAETLLDANRVVADEISKLGLTIEVAA